jgi:hypothetical protein
MKRLPRLLASAALGALLPLGFLGCLLRGDPVSIAPAVLPAFYIVPPALLFVMMASAVWILLPGFSAGHKPVSSSAARVPIRVAFTQSYCNRSDTLGRL